MATILDTSVKKLIYFNERMFNTYKARPWIVVLLSIMYLGIISSGIAFWTLDSPHWDMTIDARGPQSFQCNASPSCEIYGWKITSSQIGGMASLVLPQHAIICAYDMYRFPVQPHTENSAIMKASSLYLMNADHTCGTKSYAIFATIKLVPGSIDFIIAILCSSIALLVFYHATQRRLVNILLLSMTAATISLAWYPPSLYGNIVLYTVEIVDALVVSPTILVIFLWEILFPLQHSQHVFQRLRAGVFTFFITVASFISVMYLAGVIFQQPALFAIGSGPLLYFYQIAVFSSPVILVIIGNIIWRSNPQRDYARILGMGTVVGFVPLILLFTILPSEMSNFAIISVVAFPIALSYAILRHDLLKVDSLVWRSARLAIQFIGLVTFAVLGLAAFTTFVPLPGNDTFSFIYLVVGIALVAPFWNSLLIWITEHWILPEISRYRTMTKDQSMTMDTILEPNQIANELIGRVKLAIPVRTIALFIEDTSSGRYLRIVHNMDLAALPAMYEKNHPVPQLLREHNGDVVAQEEVVKYQRRLQQSITTISANLAGDSFAGQWQKNQWSIYVPIILRKQLIGFLALGQRDDSSPYSETDLNLMKNIIARNAILLDYSRLVNELRQAVTIQEELNKQKDSFILTIHHEIRTPLTGLLGYIELLRQMGREWREEQPEEVESFLEKASHSAEQLGQLMYALQQAGQESINRANMHSAILRVKEVIASVAESVRMAHEPNVQRISMQCDQDITVWVDPQAFTRVMTNLIGNAVKYSDAPQPIIVVAKSHPERDAVEIAVRDWGVGIPVEEQERIFNPFVRLNTRNREVSGTGLGLYVTHSLVESMGGSIRVESSGEPGFGSTFLIELPTVQK